LREIKNEDVSGRDRVWDLVKDSELNVALDLARAIKHPWYRCQSLSRVAEIREPLSEKRELIREAVQAALECEEPNRIVTVASWPLKVMADNGLAEDIREQLDPLLEILKQEENPVRRIDALAHLVAAFRNGPMDCFYRVLSQFEEECRVCRSWKGDYNLRIVAPLVDEVDRPRAAKLLELFKRPRMRRLTLKEIEASRLERTR
jgi:hypothetical protein